VDPTSENAQVVDREEVDLHDPLERTSQVTQRRKTNKVKLEQRVEHLAEELKNMKRKFKKLRRVVKRLKREQRAS
jgi:hypothetical protein